MPHQSPSSDPKAQNASLPHKVAAAFERISTALRALQWDEGKRLGLTPIQMQLLLFLYTHEARFRKVSYLAKEFSVTKATVSEAVKTLETKRLIEKRRSGEDSRSFELHLTTQGEATAAQISQQEEPLVSAIEQLPEWMQVKLMEGLSITIRSLQESGTVSLQRNCFNCGYFARKGGAYYCQLLQEPLAQFAIRLDCPEHLPTEP